MLARDHDHGHTGEDEEREPARPGRGAEPLRGLHGACADAHAAGLGHAAADAGDAGSDVGLRNAGCGPEHLLALARACEPHQAERRRGPRAPLRPAGRRPARHGAGRLRGGGALWGLRRGRAGQGRRHGRRRPRGPGEVYDAGLLARDAGHARPAGTRRQGGPVLCRRRQLLPVEGHGEDGVLPRRALPAPDDPGEQWLPRRPGRPAQP
mmetsp:Transcript_12645/g.36324  ORF Transcript_12645/g.36324 Transcript_12645/m.36324 type:complete len:209 (-) Transcript_12645:1569-2195(-)